MIQIGPSHLENALEGAVKWGHVKVTEFFLEKNIYNQDEVVQALKLAQH